MFRRSVFWIGFACLSLVAVLFSYSYFSRAFPIVTLDLRMDRVGALQEAAELAQRFHWGPEDFRQAASFDLDSSAQTYIELEAGGTEAFSRMLSDHLYAPYVWSVRHFKELEVNETWIHFTPDGTPYEFEEHFSEDEAGAVLEKPEALEIAEQHATADWNIDLNAFALIDTQVENQPGGRRDYTFVYERPDVKAGEALYRMNLMVSGDRFSGINHYLKVPEAFSRRYQEMRASNDTIAVGASFAMGILYLLGGCIIGLFFLLRKRWVVWKRPLQWGGFIGVLLFLSGINELPLAWMHYDTAVSSGGFLFRQVAESLGGAAGMAVLLGLSFMAAESLTRKAFPHHIQLWKVWSPGAGSSTEVLGRTLAGYLLVGLFFAYEVLLYFVSTRYLGWWSPSEALFHPDALATYFPWLSSIAISLQAGFWEECLFRAVPLAGAALLGQRFGKRNWWILGAFLLQALIFGAGHANYPAQPAYARLVELILPSFLFAAIYLSFGLLTGIVLHFAFDVVWFALPIFVAESPGIWVDRLLIVALALVPLWIVLLARLRHGRWSALPSDAYNRAWAPPPLPERTETPGVPDTAPLVIPTRTRTVLLVGGLVGLAVWLTATPFTNLSAPIRITRAEALARAEQILSEKGFQLGSDWQRMPTVQAPLNENDRFVWQEGGPEAYARLIDNFLGSAYWEIRVAKFEGDVAERAEEFLLRLDGTGKLLQFTHTLPEARPGATLSEDEARQRAEAALTSAFGRSAADLDRVSSEPAKKPNRQDWVFNYADRQAYPLQKGEARYQIQVSGDEVTDAFRYIHVPEEWLRAERSQRNITGIIAMAGQIVLVILLITGAVLAIISWSRKRFAPKAFLVTAGILFVLTLMATFLNWPDLMARLSTAQPLNLQIGTLVVASVIAALFSGGTIGLAVGLSHFWNRSHVNGNLRSALILGVAVGLLGTGLLSLVAYLNRDLTPTWASYQDAGSTFPVLALGLGALSSFLTRTAIVLLLISLLHRLTRSWTIQKPTAGTILLLIGLALAAGSGVESLVSWLLGGTATAVAIGLAYRFVFRVEKGAVPVAIAALSAIGIIHELALSAFPGAVAGGMLGLALVVPAAVLWARTLQPTMNDEDDGTRSLEPPLAG